MARKCLAQVGSPSYCDARMEDRLTFGLRPTIKARLSAPSKQQLFRVFQLNRGGWR